MDHDEREIHPLNAKGKYYVEQNTCLDHEICVEEAPDNFKLDNDKYCAFVYKQPTSEKEMAQCRAALEACPVEAIHDDGDLT